MEAIGRGLIRRWRDRIDDGAIAQFPHRIYTFQGVFFSPLECASRMSTVGVLPPGASGGRLGGVSPAYQALQTDPGRRQGSPGLGQGFPCVHIAGSLAPSPSLTTVRRKAQLESP